MIKGMLSSITNNLIWITGSGLYHEVPDPFGPWIENYVGHVSKEDTRRVAKIIENSFLQYSIIRATYMTNNKEIDHELTKNDETFKGMIISRSSIADFVIKIINNPEKYMAKVTVSVNLAQTICYTKYGKWNMMFNLYLF